jgi:hypothetical protein
MDKAKILAVISNPDFWRGLVYVLAGAGITLNPEQIQAITALGFAISGAIHVFSATK